MKKLPEKIYHYSTEIAVAGAVNALIVAVAELQGEKKNEYRCICTTVAHNGNTKIVRNVDCFIHKGLPSPTTLQGEVKGYKDCCTVCLPVPTRGFRRTDGSFHCGSCCSCHTAKVSARADERLISMSEMQKVVDAAIADERRRLREGLKKQLTWTHQGVEWVEIYSVESLLQ